MVAAVAAAVVVGLGPRSLLGHEGVELAGTPWVPVPKRWNVEWQR